MADAHQNGIAAARTDIAAGRLKLFSGAPSRTSWAADLADTLRAKFEIEVEFVSDLTHAAKQEFEAGYNETVKAHIDSIFGQGSLDAEMKGVQSRRKKLYDEYFAERALRRSRVRCSRISGHCTHHT
jgi:hypothetical protein